MVQKRSKKTSNALEFGLDREIEEFHASETPVQRKDAPQKRSKMNILGISAFLLGMVAAILLGAFPVPAWTTTTVVLSLAGVGVVVGLLNVTDKEIVEFLVAVVTLIVVASALTLILDRIPVFGPYLEKTLIYLILFMSPGAAVVAIKTLLNVASDR